MNGEEHVYFEMAWICHQTRRLYNFYYHSRQRILKETTRQRAVREETLPFRRELYPILRQELGDCIRNTYAGDKWFHIGVLVGQSQLRGWRLSSLRLAALEVRYRGLMHVARSHHTASLPLLRITPVVFDPIVIDTDTDV